VRPAGWVERSRGDQERFKFKFKNLDSFVRHRRASDSESRLLNLFGQIALASGNTVAFYQHRPARALNPQQLIPVGRVAREINSRRNMGFDLSRAAPEL